MLTFSVALYMKKVVAVAVIALAKKLEIREQDLVHEKLNVKCWLSKHFVNNMRHELG